MVANSLRTQITPPLLVWPDMVPESLLSKCISIYDTGIEVKDQDELTSIKGQRQLNTLNSVTKT